jgi:hypothetical protein
MMQASALVACLLAAPHTTTKAQEPSKLATPHTAPKKQVPSKSATPHTAPKQATTHTAPKQHVPSKNDWAGEKWREQRENLKKHDFSKRHPLRRQCSDTNLEQATQVQNSLGGYCCSKSGPNIACPSKEGRKPKDTIVTLDGKNRWNRMALGRKGCGDSMLFHGVQTQGPNISLRITNASEYPASWPIQDPDDELALLHPHKGYAANGKRRGDMITVDLCVNKLVKLKFCFENDNGDPVQMERANIRVFDLDYHSKSWKKGPEAVQFNCTGGTFSVFGAHPFMSWTAGKPISIEKNSTHNGLTKYTFLCPDDNIPVTMWSSRVGNMSDNPFKADEDSLTGPMENSMILISYKDVQCGTMTIGNMPPRYHQNEWHDKDGTLHKAWPIKAAKEGGNPLNSSKSLFDIATDILPGECPTTGPYVQSNNWLFSGHADDVTSPCTTVSINHDPMFVVNGVHRHFWLPAGKLTRLMQWKVGPEESSTYVLSGETFGHGSTQWFGTYAIDHNGREVLRVSISISPTGDAATKLKQLGVSTLSTMSVDIDGKPVVSTGKVYKSSTGVSALVTSLPMRLIGDSHAENVEIRAPGLGLTISSARAKKYSKESAQVRWSHLNMKVVSTLPRSATGLLAELAGMRPMSEMTKSFLTVPEAVADHRQRMLSKRKTAEQKALLE